MRKLLLFLFIIITPGAYPQTAPFEQFLRDSVMSGASVSFLVADVDSGNILHSYNAQTSLIPASTMKLVTTSAAFELLGPEYTFKTKVGYSGTLNNRNGKLDGDIVISGGGDPSLGSEYFNYHYEDFISTWAADIKKAGIRKIRGRVISDDSYYDYEPVLPRWLWEDIGAYYGAGVYGLSVFDNSCKISVRSAPDSSHVDILGIYPFQKDYVITNRLVASGTIGNWYVFFAPYSKSGWLSGTVPVTANNYIIDASIPDPPLLIAELLNDRLEAEGINISDGPTTKRVDLLAETTEITSIAETVSPPLSVLIDTLNKESVNLYAEHLAKELGRKFKNTGTTNSGISVIRDFLGKAGIDTTALFIEDGSGLSSRNGLNAEGIVRLLIYMKNKGKYFHEFYSTLPDAGKNGTLAQYFTDPVFASNLKAKSGSMTRVRCYAGYFTTQSGKNLAFSILVNNFQGQSKNIITHIENIIKEIIIDE